MFDTTIVMLLGEEKSNKDCLILYENVSPIQMKMWIKIFSNNEVHIYSLDRSMKDFVDSTILKNGTLFDSLRRYIIPYIKTRKDYDRVYNFCGIFHYVKEFDALSLRRPGE